MALPPEYTVAVHPGASRAKDVPESHPEKTIPATGKIINNQKKNKRTSKSFSLVLVVSFVDKYPMPN
jgi:hypothetical protein